MDVRTASFGTLVCPKCESVNSVRSIPDAVVESVGGKEWSGMAIAGFSLSVLAWGGYGFGRLWFAWFLAGKGVGPQVAALAEMSLLVGIFAAVLAALGLRQIRKARGHIRGKEYAISGVSLGLASVFLEVVQMFEVLIRRGSPPF